MDQDYTQKINYINNYLCTNHRYSLSDTVLIKDNHIAGASSIQKAVDIIMLDNITLDRLQDVAKTGVDIISIGTLTHSVSAMDISQKFVK